jgi:uncharacterized protein YoxC
MQGQGWLGIFVVVAAVAIVFQAAILMALFIETRRTLRKAERIMGEVESRMGPLLSRVQLMLDDLQPKVSTLVSDAAHVVYLARGQAQKVDRVLTELSDRVRGQLVHADRIITGALESIEEAGTQFRRSVWRPVHKVSALVQGIKVGLDVLRARRGRNSGPEEHLEQEEELFI